MSQLIRRDPVFNRMDQFFNRFGSRDPLALIEDVWEDQDGTLAIDLADEGEDLVVKASLPGFKREEVTVQVNDGVLEINATHEETKEETHNRYYRRERQYGSMARRVSLPTPVNEEKADARLVDGELTLRLPKSTQSLSHRIKVK